jgi:hypothetical protein
MTVDQLLRLAIQIGAKPHSDPERWGHLTISHEDVERFAALVILYEREECARVADRQNGDDERDPESCVWSKAARHIATAIRARGEK